MSDTRLISQIPSPCRDLDGVNKNGWKKRREGIAREGTERWREREGDREKGRKCKGAEEEIGEKCGAGRQVRRMKKNEIRNKKNGLKLCNVSWNNGRMTDLYYYFFTPADFFMVNFKYVSYYIFSLA